VNPSPSGRFRTCRTSGSLTPRWDNSWVSGRKMNQPIIVRGRTPEAIGPSDQSEPFSAVRLPTDLTAEIDAWATVLIGGLIKEDDEKTVSGIPGINEIKYLGDLLSQKSDSKTRSEIIVFVTTKLVRNSHDAQVVAEEFRERLDTLRRSPTPLKTPTEAQANVKRE
jgi:hypothetical protein